MLRPFQASDYPTVVEWWKANSFPPLPLSYLPKTGVIIDDLCAGFLYRTDSDFAWVEWIVCNPSAEKEARRAALDQLIDAIVYCAKESGFKGLFTSVSHEGLLERYKKHGFVVTDNSVTHLFRSL